MKIELTWELLNEIRLNKNGNFIHKDYKQHLIFCECENCNKNFFMLKRGQNYCSQECKRKIIKLNLIEDLPTEIKNNLEFFKLPTIKNKNYIRYKINNKIYYKVLCNKCNREFLSICYNSKYCTLCRHHDELNGFKNKKHSEKSKKKLSFARKNKTYEELYGIEKSNKLKEKWHLYLTKNNPMKNEESRKKVGLSNKGEKNGMFGKYNELNPNYKKANFQSYDFWAEKISWHDEVRRCPNNLEYLEVKCTYCGRWHIPDMYALKNRANRIEKDFSKIYCSQECKDNCPTYSLSGARIKQKNLEYESPREVQSELRKLVFERDNYTCQKCGKDKNKENFELHCHHINPVKLDPLESADINNCISLCKDCHKETHKKDGCGYKQLANCINI